MNSNRNRGRSHARGLCPGGRKCCGDPLGNSKREARRVIRRVERQEWRKALDIRPVV